MQTTLYKKTGLFYILSILVPWGLWFLAAFISHSSDPNMSQASIIAFLGLLTPALIAFTLSYQNESLLNDIKGRLLLTSEVKLKYMIVGCGLMLVSILLAQAISLLFGYSPTQFKIAEQFSFTSGVFPVWFMLIIAPLLEELAWHSYGTDCLRNHYNLFTTSVIFALFWGVWHLPLSLINDYYHSNLLEDGWIYSVNFVISLFPFVIIMNWIYYKTNRNILLTVIFHITAGFFNEIFQTHPMSKVFQTALLLVLAVYLIMNEREFFLTK